MGMCDIPFKVKRDLIKVFIEEYRLRKLEMLLSEIIAIVNKKNRLRELRLRSSCRSSCIVVKM